MLKISLFSLLLVTTTTLWAQAKTAKAADTGYVAKNEKLQNKIPIKCKSDTTCIDETGVILNAPTKGKAGVTKQ